MVATAESVHDQDLRGGVEHEGAAEAAGGRRKRAQTGSNGSITEEAARAYGAAKKAAAARPEARTEFRGVYRAQSGKYGAQIRHSKGQTRWLGTFGTAEEAARAYDEAAVRLHGAGAVTNYKQDGVSWSDGQATVKKKKKKPAAARPDARTEFVGVYRHMSGRYFANLWDPERKKAATVGRFDTAEEAARAYDAAAVKMYGTAAKTNFEQQHTAGTAIDGDESSMDLLSDFPDLPALDAIPDNIIPGLQLDDLNTDLTPSEWQQVDEFLKDMDFTDVVA